METRQSSQNFARAQRMFAKHLQHVRKQRDAGSEKNQPGHIERIGVLRGSPADAGRPGTNRRGQSEYSRRK